MFKEAILFVAALIALNVDVIRAQYATVCPDGWRQWKRPSGAWCWKVFAADNYDYEKASKLCIGQGSVVSGLQSWAENVHVIIDSNIVLGGKTGSVWIGARRTKQCLKKKLSDTCSQKTAFSWTDNSATGTSGFLWIDDSQPDNAHGLTQDCMVLFAADTIVSNKNVDWIPGALDDVACSTAQMDKTGPRVVRAVLCGKPARNETIPITPAPK